MNIDEQIIALGTLDGFTDIHGGDTGAYWRGTKGGRCEPLLDYDSLDVMHRLWKTLPPSKKDKFESELYGVVIGQADYNRNDDAPYITNATAAQRREALLRTLDLWKTPQ